jgi:lincosamide and streptogramin A transport system ATP-binding/permease protein
MRFLAVFVLLQEVFMSLIHVSNLTFAYEGSYDTIFENVSFQIDTDWRLGFTGRNGRGKTTFLMLLMGQYAYQGSISASVDFEYFPYAIPDKSLPVIEVAGFIHPQLALWALEKEFSLLNLAPEILYRPFDTLSGGEQCKALLAILFTRENGFMLIDEPTNHLDAEGRALIARYLKTKRGFILVSHDRAFLDGCVDHILSINRADITVQKGNFSSWWQNKERQDAFELAENEKLEKEIGRLKEAARRTADWSERSERDKIGFYPGKEEKSIGRRSYLGEKSRKMMKRSKVIGERQQSAIDEKSLLLKNIERSEDLKLSPLAHHAQRLVFSEDLIISRGGRQLFTGLSFDISQGERVAVCGGNGSGKTSLFKLLLGEDMEHSGQLTLASGLKISAVSQDTSSLQGSLFDYAKDKNIERSLFLAILRKLDFPRVQFEKDMQNFSEGQKKKVLIAGSLCERSHLYIWDEPLNFVDVISRMQIEALIVRSRPTMLFAEHDRAFVQNIATKTLALNPAPT